MELFKTVIIIEGAISLMLCLLIIFAYLRFKRVDSFAFRLVMMLCIADAFNSIGYLLAIGDFTKYTWLCQAGGFLNQFSNMSSFIITSLIAYTVLVTVVYDDKQVEKKANYFYILAYLIPALVAGVPSALGEFEEMTTFYCWLNQDNLTNYILFAVGTYFGLLWISVVFFIYCLCRVQGYLNGYAGLDRSTALSYKKLLKFPIILMVCWLPATAYRVLICVSDGGYQHSQWMNFTHMSFDMLATVLNVLVFGFNDQVRKEYRRYVFSKQSVQNYKDLDEEDNKKKVTENPALQKLYLDASLISNPVSNFHKGSDIAFFMNEDDERLGYKPHLGNKIKGGLNKESHKISNYSED